MIVDEAGMVGAASLRRLQEHLDKAGGKMLMLGDPQQLQPVEAGSPFRLIIQENGASELTEIRRQKGEVERQIATEFYSEKSGKAIIEDLVEKGMLQTTTTKDEAVKDLVEKYLANEASHSDKLILANTRADVTALTQTLREALKEKGELTRATTVTVAGKKFGETEEMEVCLGDRLSITKNSPQLGLANGDRGIVQHIEQDRFGTFITLRLESDVESKNNKIVRLNLNTFNRLDYAWASTNHAAQGQGKDHVFWLASAGPNMDRNMAMVAFTRLKKSFQSVCTEDHLERLKTQIEEWGEKKSAQELAEVKPAPEPLKPMGLVKDFLTMEIHFDNALTAFKKVLEEREQYAAIIKAEAQRMFKAVREKMFFQVGEENAADVRKWEDEQMRVVAEAVRLENTRDREFDTLRGQMRSAEQKVEKLQTQRAQIPDGMLHSMSRNRVEKEIEDTKTQRQAVYQRERELQAQWAGRAAEIRSLRSIEAECKTRLELLKDIRQLTVQIEMKSQLEVDRRMSEKDPDWERKQKPLAVVLKDAQDAAKRATKVGNDKTPDEPAKTDEEAQTLAEAKAKRQAKALGLERTQKLIPPWARGR